MDGRIAYIKKHPLTYYLILSLVLHLLLLFLYTRWGTRELFQFRDIVDQKPEKKIVFEIVETPSESNVPPEKAEYVSDKNALASDLSKKKTTSKDLPFSIGDFKVGDFPRAARKIWSFIRGAESNDREQLDIKGNLNNIRQSLDKQKFSKEKLLGHTGNLQSSDNRPIYDQRTFYAEQQGAISFNTYEWDFAPYLLKLKRRIERNIYPPPAFTRLGFGGQNILKFRINLEGQLEGPQILGYEGEKALVETSRKAIESSAPFWPLPDDFPEEYLEVTARFFYMGRDNYSQR